MKRALPVLTVAVALIALFAWAGPRPYATLTVVGNGVSPVCMAASEGASFVFQAPSEAVYYRTVNAAELADANGLTFQGFTADGSVVGYGMNDGGPFGVFADFRNQGDPIGVVLGVNQVGVCLLGIDAGGTYPTYFSTP